MKMIKKIGIITLSVLALLFVNACEPETLVPVSEMQADTHMQFRAVWEGAPETKTAVQGDGVSVWWTTNENFNVFYQGKTGKFTSLNTKDSPSIVLDGILDTETGVGDAQSTECWAIYPYSANNSFDGTTVTITVPYEQTAKAGSFADNLFPAIARSNTSDLTFFNVCGGVCFTVANSNISKVVFTSKNGEALTGKVRVGFDDNGLPVVREFINGREDLTVSGSFVTGACYYAAILPKTLRDGLIVTCYSKTGNLSCQMEVSKSITVNRSRFGKLLNVDIRSLEGIRMAVEGLGKVMHRQFNNYGQGYNGEGTVRLYIGDYLGNNLMKGNSTSFLNSANGDLYESNTATLSTYVWDYYYQLIAGANEIIRSIDGLEGDQSEKAYLKAQALTYRAFAYSNLVQVFGRRWSDGQDNPACVLRLTGEEPGSLGLSTVGQVYAQVYTDLDQAISLFNRSGKANSRTQNYTMDLDVAYAIYARAALTREDWSRALNYARLARKNYPLMSVADEKAGFCNPASEWIWYLYGNEYETLYYYDYFAYVAYNASSSTVRNYPLLISRHLFEQIPATDIRRGFWLDPAGYEGTFNTNTMKANGQNSSNALYKYAFDYSKQEGRVGLYSNATVSAYMQFKIRNNAQPGIGHLCLFRSSEMVLIEAEAQYHLGNEGSARDLLVELNATSQRDPAYTCNKTGTALMDQIKLYRGIELWAEGFNWFDLKRWGDSISRTTYDNGGNWMSQYAVSYGPDEKNYWTWVIPQIEIDRNPALQ